MTFNGPFGSWLKHRRKALDLTQTDLASQVGCSVMTIRKFEGGGRRPSKQIAGRIADVLAITLDERAAFLAFARGSATNPTLVHAEQPLSAAVHYLPAPLTSFIGRTDELALIAARLANPACRL